MFCPDKLKLNKFRFVRIPTNAEYFGRFGFADPSTGVYSGDQQGIEVGTKIDNIEKANSFYEEYAESMSND